MPEVTASVGVAPDPSLDRFARVVRDAVGVPVALVTLVEQDRQVFPGAVGLPAPWQARRETPLTHSFCQYVVREQAALVVDDARTDARLRDNAAIDDLGVVAYAGYPLRDGAGTVIGSVCAIDTQPHAWTETELRTIEDIADICSTEMVLRETRAALDRSHENLSVFAGQISHDLKTPLSAILGFVELHTDAVTDGSATSERALGYLVRCADSGNRMLRTIDDLLAYASIGGTLHRRTVGLDEVMTAVVDDLGPLVADASITWDGTDVYADPTQLRALLQNLVGNALKYQVAGRPCTVRVAASRRGEFDELCVADNGSGIPASRRADAVQPLVRLRDDLPGAGLGLATCVRITNAHRGILRLSRTPGGGCTVTVTLPATPQP